MSKRMKLFAGIVFLAAVSVMLSPSDAHSTLQAGSCNTLEVYEYCIARVLGAGLVGDIAFSPNNQIFAFTSSAAGTQVYNISGEVVQNLVSLRGGGLAFSPDGNTLAVGTDGAVRLLRVSNGTETSRFEGGHEGIIQALDYSPDGTMLASGGQDGVLTIWDVSNSNLIASEPVDIAKFTQGIQEVIFLNDSQLAVSGDFGASIYELRANGTLARLRNLNSGPFIRGLSVSPNGRYLATSGSGTDVKVWRMEDFSQLYSWEIVAETGQERGSYSVGFTSDNRSLVVGEIHTHNAQNAGLRIFRLSDGEQERRISGTLAHIEHLVISHDGKYAASFTTYETNYVLLWKLK